MLLLQVLGVVAYMVLLAASVWGMSKVKNGLNLTDIVPHQATEYGFLAAHDKYSAFYNMYAVTQGNFEYPNNQRSVPSTRLSIQSIQSIHSFGGRGSDGSSALIRGLK